MLKLQRISEKITFKHINQNLKSVIPAIRGLFDNTFYCTDRDKFLDYEPLHFNLRVRKEELTYLNSI